MTNQPEDFPPEFLAAYVDGELGPRDRARVEHWLADHPEARELLETQESFAATGDLCYAMTPPQPSSRQWAECYAAIARRLQPPVRPRRWAALGVAAIAVATAAAVVVMITATEPTAPSTRQNALVELAAADEVPYPMAADDDVRIVSLPEAAVEFLVVGEHPLADAKLILARADEVEFFGVGSDLAGRFPDVPGDPGNDVAPLLWPPR